MRLPILHLNDNPKVCITLYPVERERKEENMCYLYIRLDMEDPTIKTEVWCRDIRHMLEILEDQYEQYTCWREK